MSCRPLFDRLSESIVDGWYADGSIDWDDLLDRLDGGLHDGTRLDLGDPMLSPAVEAVRVHVRAYRKR